MANNKVADGKTKLSKLEKLEQQKAKIHQLISQEKTKQKKQSEKDRTHRLCVIGGSILAQIKEFPEKEKDYIEIYNRYIKNNKDRKLFGLPPLSEVKKD